MTEPIEQIEEQAASRNAGYWAVMNEIKLQDGVVGFKTRKYQKEPRNK